MLLIMCPKVKSPLASVRGLASLSGTVICCFKQHYPMRAMMLKGNIYKAYLLVKSVKLMFCNYPESYFEKFLY